jgi:glucose/arabinose dehydrogenase
MTPGIANTGRETDRMASGTPRPLQPQGRGRTRNAEENANNISQMSSAPPTQTLQPAARWRGSRIFSFKTVLAVLVVVGVSAWLLKGRGLWSHVVRPIFFPTPAPPPTMGQPPVEGKLDPAIHFQQVPLPTAVDAGFTCVKIGPDGQLYAAADDGRIFRFHIQSDGALDKPTIIDSLQKAEGGRRLLLGFCFDPAATAQNPIIWATHSYYAFLDVPDWTGRVSRMRGKDLETVEDVVSDLPRSAKDHSTNQPAFGPDGALYFPQGSESSSGAPDKVWSNRPEHLLNASILRLDVTKVTPGRPIDVRTRDAGGSYDPYTRGAPLTIYASGLRNAYSLVWHHNGNLYVPVNGASNGGNTPAGDGIPAQFNLPDAEDDWLFRINSGKYYGHPNPQQQHYVLNGGNPDGKHRYNEIPQYPVGTPPDVDYEPPILDFGQHCSADGVIEYRGNFFGGKLDGSLLVCRYNAGSDILCVDLDASGNVAGERTGSGLTGLQTPLSLTEDLHNGNLYVCEYLAKRIMLLRVTSAAEAAHPPGASASPNTVKPKPTLPTND